MGRKQVEAFTKAALTDARRIRALLGGLDALDPVRARQVRRELEAMLMHPHRIRECA